MHSPVNRTVQAILRVGVSKNVTSNDTEAMR